jgi:hypothetical protein
VLLTTRLDGTVDGTYWQAFILGGPYQGYGGGGTTFSNMQVNLDGITFAGPWNTTYGGGGFLGIAALRVLSAGMSVLAVFSAASSTTWPTLAVGGPTNVSTALVTPDINNGTPADITYFTALGIATGVRALEHVAFQSIYAQCCITALDATDPSTTGAAHINVTGKYLSAENCVSAVANFTGAVSKVDIDVIDLENTTYAVNDTTPAVTGQVGVTGNYSAHYGAIAVNGAANVKIKDLMQSAGAVTSPQAAPATTVAWANSYYRDAEITCSISGGTLTTLSIGGPGGAVAQTIPASTTFYRFTLPAGRAYTPAYTGALTHTVTLL